MRLENLTTVSSYKTEKVTSNVVQQSIVNTPPSGVNDGSGAWQFPNLVNNSYNLTDEDNNTRTYTQPPLFRCKWSIDGGAVWYDSGTQIPYTYTLNWTGTPPLPPPQILPATRASCTLGVNNSQMFVRTASNYHGDVAFNIDTFNATWTGISQTFLIRYVTLEPANDNIVVSSKNTIPMNKIMASGTANFSGSVPSFAIFTQDIDIDYEPEFFAVELDVVGHVFDPMTGNHIPNNVFLHDSTYPFIVPAEPTNLIFVSGGIVSGGSPKLRINAMVGNGTIFGTTASFSVRYRIIDLGVKQQINGSNMNNLALSNVANSPSRGFTVQTATGGTEYTTTSLSNPYSGIPFVDYYFDSNNDGVYWKNGYRQDNADFGAIGDTTPKATIYTSASNATALWIPGFSTVTGSVSPSGRGLRYVVYGDYVTV